jgi:hypothetical protein
MSKDGKIIVYIAAIFAAYYVYENYISPASAGSGAS